MSAKSSTTKSLPESLSRRQFKAAERVVDITGVHCRIRRGQGMRSPPKALGMFSPFPLRWRQCVEFNRCLKGHIDIIGATRALHVYREIAGTPDLIHSCAGSPLR